MKPRDVGLVEKPDITRPIEPRAPSIRCTERELFSQPRVTGILVETGVPGGVLMPVLASGTIPCGEWVRFVMLPIAKWFVICIGALIIGVWID
ncbi:MAG TPA: hypothetical protein VGA15_24310 [Bradyrhizobium sp.]